MINYKYADLFKVDSVDKQFKIATDDEEVIITNAELHSEQFELNESICSDNTLRFGSCEASSIKFKMSNVFTSLKDKWITVSAILDGNSDEPFVFGRYKVDSDKPTADKRYRDAVAYDAMYDILTADVAEWYNSLTFPMPLKTFRNAFILHFGLQEVETSLPNDEMSVEKTIEPTELSGKDVITAICEINGCFGHINRGGKFAYIVLSEIISGVYPSDTLFPSDSLYPQERSPAYHIKKSKYISATYEDFVTQKITKLQIRQEENDIGAIVGSGDNCYIIEDNFLVYGKSPEQLDIIAANLFSAIKYVNYRPANVNAIGNPCIEVGDAIRLNTKYQIVESYVFKRTFKGIQGLKDAYDSKGKEYYDGNVNSVQKSIIQLKGKTNTLIRTIEETRSKITNVEQGLSTQILQNASSIELEAVRAIGRENELSGQISLTADSFQTQITGLDGKFSALKQTVEGFTFESQDGTTKISGSSIETGIIKGVTTLFIEQNRLFWACGSTNILTAQSEAEWACDSNALFSHDEYGNRSIELDRKSGNGVFYGDVIVISNVGNLSLINTWEIAVSASAVATNAESLALTAGSDISAINTRISGIDTEIASLNTHIGNVQNGLGSLSSAVVSAQKDIDTHYKITVSLLDRMDKVEAALGL